MKKKRHCNTACLYMFLSRFLHGNTWCYIDPGHPSRLWSIEGGGGVVVCFSLFVLCIALQADLRMLVADVSSGVCQMTILM